MLSKIVLAVVVAVIVTLGCMLIGGILITLSVAVAVTVGQFLKDYGTVIGVLAGLWFFFSNASFPSLRG